MSAEIRSKCSSPICIPSSAHQDYFYLQDFGWYHFSKRGCASAAGVIHLGSFDNFLWNMYVLLIPEGNLSTQEQTNISVRGKDQESNLWLKESSGSTYTDFSAAQPDKLPRLTMQLLTQSHDVPQAGVRSSHSTGFIKTPSYKKFTLLHNIYSEGVHLHGGL